MRVAFRVECGPEVGTGHLMRCLALADAFEEIGLECVFVSSSPEVEVRVTEAGWGFVPVSEGAFTPKVEADALYRADASIAVADSYQLDPKTLAAMDAVLPLAYIDDMQSAALDVSAVVNGNLTADEALYRQRYTGSKVRLLLGTEYCIMRSEFSRIPKSCVSPVVRDVLVSTGGADPLRASVRLSRLLLDLPALSEARVHVLAGSLNPNIGRLKEMAVQEPRLVIHERVSLVSELMLSCDMAIAAAGTTLNELCACGVPTVAYSLVDNQVGCPARFKAAKAALDAGDIRDPSFATRVSDVVSGLAFNVDARSAIASAGRILFDGRGSIRVAFALKSLIERSAR